MDYCLDLADRVWGTELIFYCHHSVNLLSLENRINKCSIYATKVETAFLSPLLSSNLAERFAFLILPGNKQRHYLRFCSPKNMWGLSLSRLLPFRYRLRRLVRLEKAPSWRYEMRLLPR